jgi:hypothetical protein
MTNNVHSLEAELEWFGAVLETRIQLYFGQECQYSDIAEIKPPVISNNSAYGKVVMENDMTFNERIILLLALIPHLRPQVLDMLFIHNKNFDRPFTEFGGWKGTTHSGFLPTGQTAAFIVAGTDLIKRFEVTRMLEKDHFFAVKNMLKLENNGDHEPFLSGKLVITAEYLYKCTTGETHKPDFNIFFPAKLITTPLDWHDLVVPFSVMDEILLLKSWLQHSTTIMQEWGLRRILKQGYRSLFYGPPGTGKTLTACLIGKSADLDVYRIDLSMVVSKYVGETEKNLANVFDQAQNKNWILFFDEADALFGKRTQSGNSNDRYANQEVSYLLQRIEDFPGIVILASNMKTNIDEAFARRFQSIIHFPMPDPGERRQLWTNMIPKSMKLNEKIVIGEIANDYELSGGAIINVIRHCAIKMLQNEYEHVTSTLLLEGIRKEFRKEGKVLNIT